MSENGNESARIWTYLSHSTQHCRVTMAAAASPPVRAHVLASAAGSASLAMAGPMDEASSKEHKQPIANATTTETDAARFAAPGSPLLIAVDTALVVPTEMKTMSVEIPSHIAQAGPSAARAVDETWPTAAVSMRLSSVGAT